MSQSQTTDQPKALQAQQEKRHKTLTATRQRKLTATRQQEKITKATSSLFLSEMIAKLAKDIKYWLTKKDQTQNTHRQ